VVWHKLNGMFLLAALVVLALGTAAQADTITHGGVSITMDFVTVGNTDNVADDTSYGAVDYSYNIGKYEVTENQWDAVSGIAGDLLNDPGYWSGNQPVGGISWYEAAMFSNWLTSGDVTDGAYAINGSGVVTGIDRDSAISAHGTVYVIPTENEWYKAAYYDGVAGVYYNYPTGSDSVPDGIDSSGDTLFDAVFYDGYNQGQPNAVDNAGVLSPYGTIGQGGNVWEWNETAIGSSRGLRGGFWYSNSYPLAASYRYYNDPTLVNSSIGFRVASVPEPGSMALLLCGLLSLVCLRRKR